MTFNPKLETGTVDPSILPVATTGARGVVQVDGTTIHVSSGVISAPGGGGGGITDPTTAEGDLMVREGGNIVALPIGRTDQYLGVVDGDPIYRTINARGGAVDLRKDAGDLVFRGSAVPTTIVLGFIGDSITITDPGSGTPADLCAADIAAVLGITVTVNNQAISGTTTTDWLPGGSHLPGAVTAMVTAGVRIVHIMLGTNDGRTAISVVTYQDQLESIVAYLNAHGLTAILSYSPYAVVSGGGTPNTQTQTDDIYALEPGLDALVDGAYVRQGDTQAFEYFRAHQSELPDNIHPNTTGAAALGGLWAIALLPTLFALARSQDVVIPIGSNGKVLTVVSGVPAWDTPSGGGGGGGGTALPVARYKTAAGQSIPNSEDTVVDFDTADYDSFSAVTTGSGWAFTAPTDGYYKVAAELLFESTAVPGGSVFSINLRKNGTGISSMARTTIEANVTMFTNVLGTDTIHLLAGDTIDVTATHNIGSALALHNGDTYNYVTIEQVGQAVPPAEAVIKHATLVASGSSPTLDFTSIPGGYSHAEIWITGRIDSATTDDYINLTFNGDTGANYNENILIADGPLTAASGGNTGAGSIISAGGVAQTSLRCADLTGANGPAGSAGGSRISIPLYSGSDFYKTMLAHSHASYGILFVAMQNQQFSGEWVSAAPITQITLTANSGNFVAGTTATLYLYA